MEKFTPPNAYVMLGRHCSYIQQNPELIIPVFDVLCAYFNSCEEARSKFNEDLDRIIADFQK